MSTLDRRALLRGLINLPVIMPALNLPGVDRAASLPDLNGLGMIYLDGRPVYFDSNDSQLGGGVDALVLYRTSRQTASVQMRQTVEYNHIWPCSRPRYVHVACPEGRQVGGIDCGYDCITEVPLIGRVLKS